MEQKPDGFCHQDPSLLPVRCMRCQALRRVMYAVVINGIIHILCEKHWKEIFHA